MHQTLTAAEADAFEARFEKVEKDVVIKGHDEVAPSPAILFVCFCTARALTRRPLA